MGWPFREREVRHGYDAGSVAGMAVEERVAM